MDQRPPPIIRTMRRWLAAAGVGCPKCGDNLRGSRVDACPECGLGLHPDLFAPPPPVTPVYRTTQAGALLAAGLGVAHALIHGPHRAAVGEWPNIAAMAAGAGLGLGALAWWTLARWRILRWPRHLQARAATGVWGALVVEALVSMGT